MAVEVKKDKPKEVTKAPGAPKKARQKPVYSESTQLARQQGALVQLVRHLNTRITNVEATLADLKAQREKAKGELKTLSAASAKAAAELLASLGGEEAQPAEPAPAE